MQIKIIFMIFLFLCLTGVLFGDLFQQQPVVPSHTPVTKFDERNAEEWRDLCRNFSQGDSITGEFTTPNYPMPYPRNVECVRVIHAPVDYTILLDFRGSFFEVEKSEDSHKMRISSPVALEKAILRDALVNCPFDYLEVRNGAYGFSPLIGRYCGDRFPPVIAADSGSMWLLFKSDNTLQYRGFRAVHYATPKIASPDSTKYRSHICSFSSTFSEDSTIFLGTDDIQNVYQDLFANRTATEPIECIWRVEARSKAHMLRLEFETFDLLYPNECSFNSLEVYAYTTSKSHLVKQLCGRIATYVDTRSYLAYVRIFLTESSFLKTAIRASFIPYARGKDCNESMFSCGDETCIPRALVCNGRADCFSNLDERKCGKGDRTLLNFLNSPYLVILIIIILLIVVIVACAIIINVWHRVKKRRILYTPVKRSESSNSAPSANHDHAKSESRLLPLPTAGMDSPKYRHAGPVPEPVKPLTANGGIEIVYSTHVPGPNHLPPPAINANGRLCELLPTISNDDLRLYLCRRGYYMNMDSISANSTGLPKMVARPQYSPFWDRKHQPVLAPAPPAPTPLSAGRFPGAQPSIHTGTLSSQLWAATPSATRIRPSATAESTVACCSSQSTASGSVNGNVSRDSGTDKSISSKRSKRKSVLRPVNKKGPKLSTSKAYYQTRSSSSSKTEPQQASTHKFWARVEDLITTTEDSSDAAEGRRKASLVFDHAANLSDLTNRQSSSDDATSEGSDLENNNTENAWILHEADSVLESETLKVEITDNHISSELILSV